MQFVARLTTDIIQTFEKCNPEFKYSESLNPKRFLTNPAVPVHNDGLDNANSDLILYVNLELVNKKSSRRLVFLSLLFIKYQILPFHNIKPFAQQFSFHNITTTTTTLMMCER